MKFLLVAINAKYIHSNPAIYSLKAYAGPEFEEDIELCEYTINQYLRDILADIYLKNPDAIGFSCYIWNWDMIKKLIPELVKILPYVKIWLGGPEVTYDADKIMKEFPYLKGIMIGEGEETFKQLVKYYKDNGMEDEDGIKNIPGLCLKDGYTAARELTDMTSLPFLYNDLSKFENKIIYYESSRGCPYSCSYCLSSIDKKVRMRDINIVKKELQFFLDNKVKQVKFVDRTFNCNREHTRNIWQYLLEHDNGITNFHFEVSADILEDEEIELLNKMRPGLVQLEIGVQSTNQETINAINRKMDVSKLEKIVEKIRRTRNVHQHLDLIAGLPYEDYNSFKRSFNQVYAMKPDQLQLGFLKVLKGSPMEKSVEEYGIKYLDEPPYEVLSTKWISYSDILRLKQIEEMVETFYNSGQFENTIRFIEDKFASPFEMYEKMADYFFEDKHKINSPARIQKYEGMLNFLKSFDDKNVEIYTELLTYDLYLREKLKSRPDFAFEQPKDEIISFYKDEETVKTYLPDYEGYDWKQLSKMTHLERFTYAVIKDGKPVWKMQKQKEFFVLFDYRNRDPLNGQAKIIHI